jgi:hypothetical protein
MAGIGCALSNGIAVVLQKASADDVPATTSVQLTFFVRLAHDWRYMLGIGLDIGSSALILVAVHTLPLFLVQPLIGSSIAITFIIEHYILHHYGARRAYPGLVLVLLGLVLLGIAAAPEQAHAISASIRWGIMGFLVPLTIVGAFCATSKRAGSAVWLALLSGIAFGGTAVTGRILTFPAPFWHVLYNPLVYSFAAYGIVGVMLFSIALQRAAATTAATMLVTAETIVPAFVGIALLGDTVRHGLWIAVAGGIICSTAGAVIIASIQPKKSAKRLVAKE